MKQCNRCKYAEWALRIDGGLHPSGDGWCKFEVKMPTLPASKYYISGHAMICGGTINRKEELGEHCQCYTPNEER